MARPDQETVGQWLDRAVSAPEAIGRPESVKGQPYRGAPPRALAAYLDVSPDRLKRWINEMNVEVYSVGRESNVDLGDFAEKFRIRVERESDEAEQVPPSPKSLKEALTAEFLRISKTVDEANEVATAHLEAIVKMAALL